MTSPEELDRYFAQIRQQAIINQAQLNNLENTQRTSEKQIVERTNSFCPLRQIQDLTTTSDQVQLALKEGFDDANVLRSLMCVNNSVAIFPEIPGKIGPSFKIRHYLRDLQQIGGESAEGYAMTAEVRSLDPAATNDTVIMRSEANNRPFVAKSPRKTTAEGNANQLHEYFVGAFGTNTLRSKIPNFAFIMGFFQCSPPYIDNQSYVTNNSKDDQRKVLTYCENTLPANQVNYILLENIAGSVTFAKFVENQCSFPEYLNVFTQVVLALHTARKIGFTHYDLHSENVLVLPLDQPIYIYYEDVGYVQTQHLAFIIDYGRSHIIYAGNHFGFNGVSIGIYPDRAYPLFDVYKILLFTLLDAAFGKRNYLQYQNLSDSELVQRGLLTNAEVFENAKYMVQYFYPNINLDQVGQYLIQTRKHFYSLPYSSQFDIPVIDFFKNAMVPLYENILNMFIQSDAPNNLDLLYGCARKGMCSTLQSALNDYTDPDIEFMNDPYMFYEILYESVAQNSNLEEVNRLIENGRQYYTDYLNKLQADAENKLERYQNIYKSLAPSSLQGDVPEMIKFNPNSLELYRKHVAKMVRLFDLANELLEIERITNLLNRFYPQMNTESLYMQDIAEVKTTFARLNSLLDLVNADAQYIQGLNPRTVLSINPNALWLFEKLPGVSAAVTRIST